MELEWIVGMPLTLSAPRVTLAAARSQVSVRRQQLSFAKSVAAKGLRRLSLPQSMEKTVGSDGRNEVF